MGKKARRRPSPPLPTRTAAPRREGNRRGGLGARGRETHPRLPPSPTPPCEEAPAPPAGRAHAQRPRQPPEPARPPHAHTPRLGQGRDGGGGDGPGGVGAEAHASLGGGAERSRRPTAAPPSLSGDDGRPAGPRWPPSGDGRSERASERQSERDKPLCRGLTFNRSQRGSCSATYETPTQKQVVYEWFSARFHTNVRSTRRARGRPPFRPHPVSRDEWLSAPVPPVPTHARRAGRAAAAGNARGRTGRPAIRCQPRLPRRCRIVPPGRDSDLEAFSHNPTDGSFAPLAPQPSTYTKCLNLRFLSY